MTFKELVNKVRNLVLEAKNVTIEDTESKFTSENVEGALKECIDRADEAFQEADSGKTLLSTAIGSPATSEQTFQDYANYITGFKSNISNLETQLKSKYSIRYGPIDGYDGNPFSANFGKSASYLIVYVYFRRSVYYYNPSGSSLGSNTGGSERAWITIDSNKTGFSVHSYDTNYESYTFTGYYIACFA
ncbi:hypothetical protein PV481_17920 [Clostridioides difficile]|nr:hypothetical protein [Clostridioides difficile]